MTFSQIAVIINPYVVPALRGSTAPTAPSRFLSVFLLLLFSISCTRYLLEEAEICPTYQRDGRGRGSCWEAKSPPIQRMLITYVLSRAEPGLPLWIKREIVSCALIFHHPQMFGRSLSSNSCAGEIIRAHSEQRNPSFSGCWTSSPWILWGHWWPRQNLKCSRIKHLLSSF